MLGVLRFSYHHYKVEFGKPRELLRKYDGILRSLVDESGDRATLYAMEAEAEAQTWCYFFTTHRMDL